MAKKKRSTTRNRTTGQHYVAQGCLRGFGDEKERVWCYDKADDRAFRTSTANVAQESNFYEIHPANGMNVADNAVEDVFKRLVSDWIPLLKAIIKSADEGRILPEQLLKFSPFVAIQWMRTKTYREMGREMLSSLGPEWPEKLRQLGFPEAEVRTAFSPEGVAAIHANQIFGEDQIRSVTRELDKHIWTIGINETEYLFYTSDHPVLRRANAECEWRIMLGLGDPGIEVVYPLDSRHILLIMERTHFDDWKKHDNGAIRLTADQVRDYNALQVRGSWRHILCGEDDFDLARELCVAEPIIRNPKRPRMKVESVLVNRESQTIVVGLE